MQDAKGTTNNLIVIPTEGRNLRSPDVAIMHLAGKYLNRKTLDLAKTLCGEGKNGL